MALILDDDSLLDVFAETQNYFLREARSWR